MDFTFMGLGHHAGIMTYMHYNVAGASNFAILLSGVKNWVMMRVKEGAVMREKMEGFM